VLVTVEAVDAGIEDDVRITRVVALVDVEDEVEEKSEEGEIVSD